MLSIVKYINYKKNSDSCFGSPTLFEWKKKKDQYSLPETNCILAANIHSHSVTKYCSTLRQPLVEITDHEKSDLFTRTIIP